MAPKKLKVATLEDLERIFEDYKDKPEIAHGLAVAARHMRFHFEGHTESEAEFAARKARKIRFLLSFLGEYDESSLAEEIYAEVVGQLLEMRRGLFSGKPYPLRRLVDFLGSHGPIQGVRGRVRELLERITDECIGLRECVGSEYHHIRRDFGKHYPALAELECSGMESLVRALLRYEMYDPLRTEFVEKKVYEAIPPLFKAVVEQVGEKKAHLVRVLVGYGWRREVPIAKALRLVGRDARTLTLLLNLSQAYIDEYGEPHPTAGI